MQFSCVIASILQILVVSLIDLAEESIFWGCGIAIAKTVKADCMTKV